MPNDHSAPKILAAFLIVCNQIRFGNILKHSIATLNVSYPHDKKSLLAGFTYGRIRL